MHQSAPPPVAVDRVHKRFEIPREQVNTLKERVLHPFRRGVTDTLHGLRGVSFAVQPGEFFGIVGRNGSGKSTLLKCLAGIYGVDSGSIYVNGRMSTFIELGVGFNPDLPARDNALLNATMLGLSPREARRRFDSVIDFAELREFVDLKIKNYSSGMLVRLAFSVMIHVDAEILLIDEVLAVGDAAFQQKCFDEFERIHASGATILFVTHDMGAVQRFCDRALLLEHGRPVEMGDPEHVGNRYLELNFSAQARAVEQAAAAEEEAAARAPLPDRGANGANPAAAHAFGTAQTSNPNPIPSQPARGLEPAAGVGAGESADGSRPSTGAPAVGEREGGAAGRRDGDGAAEILAAWCEDEAGERTETLPNGRPCTFAAHLRFREDVENPVFELTVQNSHRDHLLSASNLASEPRRGAFRAGEEVTFRVRFENVLAPDRYHVTPAVTRQGGAWIDRRERMLSVVVTGARRSEALLELPYELAIERGAPRATKAELVR
ncbi:MAG TPA: ABC transporter ATP-binding protein [Solirubrobacteraceae bacterium]|jgi:ABC-type polysaccharide/polyol phosphate transport system ATPase subunit|nr:ABC transporter ATP-binding protein [Solirubrobacteraceae bacterium]